MFSWEKSSSKPDQSGREGKFAKQSKMLNISAYSRLGNNLIYPYGHMISNEGQSKICES